MILTVIIVIVIVIVIDNSNNNDDNTINNNNNNNNIGKTITMEILIITRILMIINIFVTVNNSLV